jgi:hypothetical protein
MNKEKEEQQAMKDNSTEKRENAMMEEILKHQRIDVSKLNIKSIKSIKENLSKVSKRIYQKIYQSIKLLIYQKSCIKVSKTRKVDISKFDT